MWLLEILFEDKKINSFFIWNKMVYVYKNVDIVIVMFVILVRIGGILVISYFNFFRKLKFRKGKFTIFFIDIIMVEIG